MAMPLVSTSSARFPRIHFSARHAIHIDDKSFKNLNVWVLSRKIAAPLQR